MLLFVTCLRLDTAPNQDFAAVQLFSASVEFRSESAKADVTVLTLQKL
jgi:hypothetical protein